MSPPRKRVPAGEETGRAPPGGGTPTRGGWVAFARKYRPLRFEEVVGQEAVGRTLRGALRAGTIPPAVLFAGPRGVGKTTMARMLARALNCLVADGPTPDPCGTCEVCRSVVEGHALDVVEVDAASHNGVDDVREIRERVAHLPARARFKVYILDEAHMFSTAAWNAFLKTLEEPPSHARFVFATTEPEKVPETIVSRCQRFDFRRIRTGDIVDTLRSIVERENRERERPIEVSAAALESIARFARGGLRDAESMLEQAVLAGDGEVREEDLAALLGAVPREMVRAVLERAAAGDAEGTLEAYARVHATGGDGATFLGQALEMLREVTALAVAGPKSELVDAGEGEREALAALASSLGKAGALRATQALAESLRLVKATDEDRPLVEAGLLRVALAGGTSTVGEVLEALAAMEARLAGGGGGGPDPTPAAPPRESREGEAAPAGDGGAPARGAANLFGDERPPRTGPHPEDSGVLDLERVLRKWPRVLEEVKGRSASLGTFLRPGRPVLLADDAVTLAFPPSMAFHRAQCEDAARRGALEGCLEEVFGRPLRVRFETGEEEPAAEAAEGGNGDREATPAPAPAAFDRLRREEIDALRDTPAVRALEKEFRVTMVRVARKEREEPPPADDGGGAPEEESEP